MNIGHLKNETLVNDYKIFGYSTRTQLIDSALDLLREKLTSEMRQKWKQEAFNDYIEGESEYLWEGVDAEDFTNT